MERRVLAPSDLVGRRRTKGMRSVRVGGRVAAAERGRITLADAFAVLAVHGRSLGCEPGDLVVVSGAWERSALRSARIVERTPCPTPGGAGDVARFGWEGVAGRLAARSRVLATIRAFFVERDFLEVSTPLRVPAPGVDSHLDALAAEGGFLITSPELHLKRLLVGGVPRVFELARVARLDERGALHEPEFTMLEWYRAFAGQIDVQDDTEALVAGVAQALRGRSELVAPDGRVIDVTPPFRRITVRDAFRRWAGVRDASRLARTDPNRYFELLVGRVEPQLAALEKAVFLCDYPITEAALARPSPRDASVAERFELYVGGVELSNGYGELTDPTEQSRRFRAEQAARKRAGRRTYPVDERFLASLREGMPPAGGNALGVDRLVMLAVGAKSVQETIAFPSEPK